MSETFLNEWVGHDVANNCHQYLNGEKVQAHCRLWHLHNIDSLKIMISGFIFHWRHWSLTIPENTMKVRDDLTVKQKKTLNYWSAQMRICLWGEIWNVKVRNTEEKYENTKWGLGGGRSEYWVEDINAPLQQHWVNVGIWHWCQGNPRSGGTQ